MDDLIHILKRAPRQSRTQYRSVSAMRPKYQRMRFVLVSVAAMAVGVALILHNFQDNLVFFYTPSQWQREHEARYDSRPVRIGGLVKVNSVNHSDGRLTFIITDLMGEMRVTYQGMIPSLFREGQGVVAEGVVGEDGVMVASSILAKHDENYMPKEVVDQLKASGQWQEYGTHPNTENPKE